MVKSRNCGWVDSQDNSGKRVVWLRHGVQSMECPKSAITEQSRSCLDLFWQWKRLGLDIMSLNTKTVQALIVLDEEFEKEKKYVEAERTEQ